MLGLIVRLLAYVAIIAGFVIEYKNLPYQNISGFLITGGVVLLLVLAFRNAWRSRGKMGRPSNDD